MRTLRIAGSVRILPVWGGSSSINILATSFYKMAETILIKDKFFN